MTRRELAILVAFWGAIAATAVATGIIVGGLILGALSPVAASRSAEHSDLPIPSGSLTGGTPSSGVARRIRTPEPAPAAAIVPGAVAAVISPSVRSLSGWATWFRSPQGVSAAGPRLRSALGPGWRGTGVRVCATGDGPARCVVTVLGDFVRADRLIDLDDDLFARLAPLSIGVIAVTVTALPSPPETSTRSEP